MQIKNKALIGALTCGVMAVSGQANADAFWDGTDTSVNADGGDGTWDNVSTNWDTLTAAGPDTAWNSGAAFFGGTAGTVTLGDDVTVTGINFTANGYVIDGAGNTISLGSNTTISGSGTTTINTDIDNTGSNLSVTGGTTTLSGVITGSGGFTAGNGGKVILSGANTYTGPSAVTTLGNRSGTTLSVSSFNSVVGGTASSSLGAPITVADGTITLGAGNRSASYTLIYEGLAATGETTDRIIKFNFNAGRDQFLNASGGGLLKFTSAFTPYSGGQFGTTVFTGSGTGEIVQDLVFNQTRIDIEKSGSGTWTIGGAKYKAASVTSGVLIINGTFDTVENTTVSGTLNLVDDSEFLIRVGADGVNNALVGSGTVSLDGDLLLDLTGAGATLGDSWNLIDVVGLTEAFGTNFLVKSTLGSFSESVGVWTIEENEVAYQFEEATGALTVVPEPGSLALLGLGGLLIAGRRRRG